MVGIRSRTQLTPDILDKQRSLISIGCFSVGTNQVALDCASRMGLPVFNAPFSNTRSVAELTIAEIIMLFRRVQTDSEIDYVVLDCDDLLSGARDILAGLRQMPGTVRAHLFYRKI